MKWFNPEKGFTLVELTIALALIGIMAAFAVPQFQKYSRNAALKGAARGVASDLYETRQKAINESLGVYQVTFNVGANTYALSRTDTGATLWTRTPASFGSGVRLTGVNFSGGSTVSFQKRGTLSAWGSLTLANSVGSTATVSVNSTGRTYVQFAMR